MASLPSRLVTGVAAYWLGRIAWSTVPPKPSSARLTGKAKIRWGIADFVVVWLGALVIAAIASSLVIGLRGRESDAPLDAVDLVIGLLIQNIVIVVALFAVSRMRGRDSLRCDFGLIVRFRDWPWLAGGVIVGAAGIALIEVLDRSGNGLAEQKAVQILDRATGPELVVLIIGVTVIAPLAEELLFRGLLLRSLGRIWSAPVAVALSSAAFAGVHLLDPATAYLLVPLGLLGLVAGIRATRTGELSQPICLHAGFNLLSAVLLVAT